MRTATLRTGIWIALAGIAFTGSLKAERRCFEDAGAASTERSEHLSWARRTESNEIRRNVLEKIERVSNCLARERRRDEWIDLFTRVSLQVARAVPDAGCFDGNQGVVSTDPETHRQFARDNNRETVVEDLKRKVSAALRCLNKRGQDELFAEISVLLARAAR
jgi:hypothetical protein